jgi:hypothetical protein
VFPTHLIIQRDTETAWEEDTEELSLPPHPDPNLSINTLPIVYKPHQLQLCSQNWSLTLPLDTETLPTQAPAWTPQPVPITKAEILPSVSTYSPPHKIFLSECLKALEIEKTGEGNLPAFQGPPQFHLAWLQILEKTQAKPSPLGGKPIPLPQALQFLPLTQKPYSVLFPQHWEDTNSLIRSLQRGIIVSMALRAPQDLAAAREFLIQEKNEKPTDNTWKSLANLTQKTHDLHP